MAERNRRFVVIIYACRVSLLLYQECWDRCLNHAGFLAAKLGLYFTCADAMFFIRLSISEAGCISHKGEQANFSISWLCMLSPI